MPLQAAYVLAATSKTATSSGSSAASLLILVALFAIAYFLFIRPRSQAARRQRETLQELVPGDEVLTGAGIFGTVLDVASDRVTLETAPGTRITVLRSAIARRIPQPVEEAGEEWAGGGEAMAASNGADAGGTPESGHAHDGHDDGHEVEEVDHGEEAQGGVG